MKAKARGAFCSIAWLEGAATLATSLDRHFASSCLAKTRSFGADGPPRIANTRKRTLREDVRCAPIRANRFHLHPALIAAPTTIRPRSTGN